jgi:hypothetical protein
MRLFIVLADISAVVINYRIGSAVYSMSLTESPYKGIVNASV